jgi:hypothetical protein
VTWSAVRCVVRSRNRSPLYGRLFVPPKRDWNSSGHRSWWSKTNFVPSRRRSSIAIGQKMSGGLQACSTVNLPALRARKTSRSVSRNEYAYSQTKLTLLPPGA